MEFILRIFFSGLIAFIPSADQKELTVVLLNTQHEYHLAGGTTLADHKPILVARAGQCDGDCDRRDAGVAAFLFPNKSVDQAADALEGAVYRGGSWVLSNSDLHVCGPQSPLTIQSNLRRTDANGNLLPVPATAAEREDFSWVADLSQIAPSAGGFSSLLQRKRPPAGVVARLRLRSGRVFTYSLIRIDNKARPIHFRTEDSTDVPYAQALAGWVAAEIRIPGDSVEIVDENFDVGTRRRMKLSPQNGLVEMALLNLPPLDPENVPSIPGAGTHFQIFYDLATTPPAMAERPVPHSMPRSATAEPEVDWPSLHPGITVSSELLTKIGLNPRGRGPYDRVLCPVTQE